MSNVRPLFFRFACRNNCFAIWGVDIRVLLIERMVSVGLSPACMAFATDMSMSEVRLVWLLPQTTGVPLPPFLPRLTPLSPWKYHPSVPGAASMPWQC